MDAVSTLGAKPLAQLSAWSTRVILEEMRRAGLALRGSETAFAVARFLLVGFLGLASDAAVYTACAHAGLTDAFARAISLAFATGVTWRLNRAFTFGASSRSAFAESMRYTLVALCAQGGNYLLFLSLRAATPQVPALLCIVASAACAAGFSFLGQRFYTFGRASPRSAAREPAALAVPSDA